MNAYEFREQFHRKVLSELGLQKLIDGDPLAADADAAALDKHFHNPDTNFGLHWYDDEAKAALRNLGAEMDKYLALRALVRPGVELIDPYGLTDEASQVTYKAGDFYTACTEKTNGDFAANGKNEKRVLKILNDAFDALQEKVAAEYTQGTGTRSSSKTH